MWIIKGFWVEYQKRSPEVSQEVGRNLTKLLFCVGGKVLSGFINLEKFLKKQYYSLYIVEYFLCIPTWISFYMCVFIICHYIIDPNFWHLCFWNFDLCSLPLSCPIEECWLISLLTCHHKHLLLALLSLAVSIQIYSVFLNVSQLLLVTKPLNAKLKVFVILFSFLPLDVTYMWTFLL